MSFVKSPYVHFALVKKHVQYVLYNIKRGFPKRATWNIGHYIGQTTYLQTQKF